MSCLIVLSFGLNDDGQCGVEKSSPSNSSCPLSIVQFPKSIYITSISAGSRHALAFSSEGLVFSWGWEFNRLQYCCLINIIWWMHCSGCIVSKGSVYTWGSHNYGQLGVGYLPSDDCIKNYPSIYQTNICWWIPTQVQVSQESNDASYHVCF